jgi:hypothetical protein
MALKCNRINAANQGKEMGQNFRDSRAMVSVLGFDVQMDIGEQGFLL